MSSHCQVFSFTASPCTIKPLMPWRLHMYWSNSLVQDNYDLSVHHSEYSSLYWSISSTRVRFGCSSRSSSTWDLCGFEFAYKEENFELKCTGNAKTTVLIPSQFMCLGGKHCRILWRGKNNCSHSIFIPSHSMCATLRIHPLFRGVYMVANNE